MKTKIIMYASFITIGLMSCGQSNDESKKAETNNIKEELHDHSDHSKMETSEIAKKPKSPKTAAMANVGDNHVHIEYGSPSVRGRVIWGGLVPYGEVWASGAHNATSINFSKDVIIGGVDIPKGKYAFFTIPGEESWTVIINKNWDQHLADKYDEKEDVVRINVVPEENDFEEALNYSVVDAGNNKGQIQFKWEKIKVAIEIINK